MAARNPADAQPASSPMTDKAGSFSKILRFASLNNNTHNKREHSLPSVQPEMYEAHSPKSPKSRLLSFAKLINKLLPRKDKSSWNQTQQSQEQDAGDKKWRREQRKSHRESDDYLGVQGANPETGHFDALPPINSSASSEMTDMARDYAQRVDTPGNDKIKVYDSWAPWSSAVVGDCHRSVERNPRRTSVTDEATIWRYRWLSAKSDNTPTQEPVEKTDSFRQKYHQEREKDHEERELFVQSYLQKKEELKRDVEERELFIQSYPHEKEDLKPDEEKRQEKEELHSYYPVEEIGFLHTYPFPTDSTLSCQLASAATKEVGEVSHGPTFLPVNYGPTETSDFWDVYPSTEDDARFVRQFAAAAARVDVVSHRPTKYYPAFSPVSDVPMSPLLPGSWEVTGIFANGQKTTVNTVDTALGTPQAVSTPRRRQSRILSQYNMLYAPCTPYTPCSDPRDRQNFLGPQSPTSTTITTITTTGVVVAVAVAREKRGGEGAIGVLSMSKRAALLLSLGGTFLLLILR